MDYQKQAQDFLDKYGIEFHYTNLGPSMKWNTERYKYRVSFVRYDKQGNKKQMSLNFWGSNADYTGGVKALSAYDVLACISGEDRFKSFNDVIFEYGSDLTGIDVDGLLKEARDMRQFFTPAMLRDLAEIN